MDRKVIERIRAELEDVRRQALKKRDELDRLLGRVIRLQRQTSALIERAVTGKVGR